MKRTILLALACLLVMGLLPGQALAAEARGRDRSDAPVSSDSAPPLTAEVRRHTRSLAHDDVRQALAQFWTPERMEAANPADEQPGLREAAQRHRREDARERDDLRRRRDLGRDDRQPDGPAEQIAPREADAHALSATADAAATTAEAPEAMSWTPSYASSHPVARTNGKVFFTNARDGRNYVCSASVINSEGRNTVWTAGHCVHGGSGGTWHANWVFVPAYNNGAAPYGHWNARQLWSMGNWRNSSEWASDMGVAVMHPRAGWRIVQQLGGQGISWNHSKNQYLYAFGYPSQAPFTGQILIGCSGTMFPEWVFLGWSSETVGLNCDMTKGSSGGPWLRAFNGSWGYLNGVNSFKYGSQPQNMYSPYFDGTAADLYNATRYL